MSPTLPAGFIARPVPRDPALIYGNVKEHFDASYVRKQDALLPAQQGKDVLLADVKVIKGIGKATANLLGTAIAPFITGDMLKLDIKTVGDFVWKLDAASLDYLVANGQLAGHRGEALKTLQQVFMANSRVYA